MQCRCPQVLGPPSSPRFPSLSPCTPVVTGTRRLVGSRVSGPSHGRGFGPSFLPGPVSRGSVTETCKKTDLFLGPSRIRCPPRRLGSFENLRPSSSQRDPVLVSVRSNSVLGLRDTESFQTGGLIGVQEGGTGRVRDKVVGHRRVFTTTPTPTDPSRPVVTVGPLPSQVTVEAGTSSG